MEYYQLKTGRSARTSLVYGEITRIRLRSGRSHIRLGKPLQKHVPTKLLPSFVVRGSNSVSGFSVGDFC